MNAPAPEKRPSHPDNVQAVLAAVYELRNKPRAKAIDIERITGLSGAPVYYALAKLHDRELIRREHMRGFTITKKGIAKLQSAAR